MLELVGFQTMMILDPYGMTFDAVGVFGLAFHNLDPDQYTVIVRDKVWKYLESGWTVWIPTIQ